MIQPYSILCHILILNFVTVISSLNVALGLHESAHDAEGAEEGSVVGPGGQAGDDGVVGTLARSQAVRVARRQREIGASASGEDLN